MALLASDLYAFDCLNNAEDDTSTVGGGIDVLGSLLDTASEPTGVDDGVVKSNNGGDTTQTATLRYRGASGKIYSVSALLNGTGAVDLTIGQTEPFPERVLEASVTATPAGNITFFAPANGTPIAQCANPHVGMANVLNVRRMFNLSYSVVGGATVFYDKMFWRNNNGADVPPQVTAIGPVYRLTADPQTMIQQGIHTSKNDSATIANRLTAPAGVTFVDDNVDQTGPDLAGNADAQGLWIQMTVPSGHAAVKSTFTTQITAGTI